MLDIIKLINPQMRQSTTELLIVQIFNFSDFQHTQYDTPSAWPFPQSPLDQSSAIPVGQSCYLLLPGINVHHTQAPANRKREQTKDWAHDKDHEHKNSCPPHIKSLQNSEWMAHFCRWCGYPTFEYIFIRLTQFAGGLCGRGRHRHETFRETLVDLIFLCLLVQMKIHTSCKN